MKKVSFRVRNFDKEQFLTYDIDNEATLDDDVLDFLEDEEPKGIVPIIFEEEEENDTFSYDVTDKIRLCELSNQEINAEMVLKVMRGLVLSLVDMGEYRIPLSYLVLHRNYIYINSDYEVEFICVPLEELQDEVDLNMFLRNFVASLRFEPTEDGDYVARLLTYINNPALFNLRKFVALIEDLMESKGIEIPEDSSADIYVDYQEVNDEEIVESDEEVSQEDDEDETIEEPVDDVMESEDTETVEEAVEEMEVEVEEETAEEAEAEVDEEAVEEAEAEAEEEAVEEAEAEVEEETIEEAEAEAEEETIEEAEAEVEEETIEEAETEVEEETIEEAEAEVEEETIEEAETEVEEETTEEAEKEESIEDTEIEGEIIEDVEEDSSLEDSDKKAEELQPESKELKKSVKKPTFKTKDTSVTGVVIEDDFDEFLAMKEMEENEVKHEETGLKIKKSIKVNRASIVKSNQEEATEGAEEVEVAVESAQPATKTPDIPKANPYLIRVNTEERIMITKQNFKVGKASMGVDYTIKGNNAVSRIHAIIVCKDECYYVKDNKSTNHTFVNGKIIEDGENELLTNDCKIVLGDEEFVFKLN